MRMRRPEGPPVFGDSALLIKRPHIRTGYRFDHSTAECVRSVCQWHNETLNIWSHIMGLALFVAAHAYAASDVLLRDGQPFDREMCHLFFVACELCMVFSFTYHTFASHVRASVAMRLLRLDLTGICLMIGGSFLPGLFFGFYCFPAERTIYCTVNAALVAGGIALAQLNLEAQPRLGRMRTLFFAGIVASAVVPIAHWLAIAPFAVVRLFAGKLFLMLALYATGFAIYALRVPERWAPGRFDTFGHSHQWWHVLVVCAGLVWAWEMWDYYEWIAEAGCAGYRPA